MDSMDTNQYSLLEKSFLELEDSNTTPEKVLQSLSSWFLPEAYTNDINYNIFLAYFRFITVRQPGACVTGIWEDLLRKTVIYSRNLPYEFDVITREPQIWTWLDEALSTHTKCPNPYIRLELYRLIRIFKNGFSSMKRLRICDTFMYTICEIQPHHLYPSGNGDEVLFSVDDFQYIIQKARNIIFNDKMKQFIQNNETFTYSKETRFISHFIQLIGVFAVMAGSKPNYNERINDIQICFRILKDTVDILDPMERVDHLPGRFPYVFSRPPFHRYAVETIRDLTTVILNNTNLDVDMFRWMLMNINCLARKLDFCTKVCDMPRLLLSRQVHGPNLVHQHLLLLRNMNSNAKDNSEEMNLTKEDLDIWKMYNDYHNWDSETSINISNSSDSVHTSEENSSSDSDSDNDF